MFVLAYGGLSIDVLVRAKAWESRGRTLVETSERNSRGVVALACHGLMRRPRIALGPIRELVTVKPPTPPSTNSNVRKQLPECRTPRVHPWRWREGNKDGNKTKCHLTVTMRCLSFKPGRAQRRTRAFACRSHSDQPRTHVLCPETPRICLG